MRFEGQTVIVTGALRGIGRAVALQLASEGANIGLNYRSHTEEAEAVKQEIESLGQKCLLLQADVADQNAVEEMVAKTIEEFGELYGYVSNAAYSDRELMINADMDGFRRTVDVSMWGAFYGVRAASQQMVKAKTKGSIVVVSSPHGVIPIPTAMAYNMSKAAIDHMARTAAIELAEHRINVNLIHPGWIDTPGERKFFTEEQIEEGSANLPWGRMGTPEEMAKGIAFMLSADADYMTGSTVTMDGGVSLPWWSNRADGQM